MIRPIFSMFLVLMLSSISLSAEKVSVAGGLRVDDYSVSIGHKNNFGEWKANSADIRGYVKSYHMEHYEIRLGSSFRGRVDAKVEIDGKEIGTFRIRPYSSIILERSVDDAGRFTFVRSGTREFYDANLNRVSASNRGLIKVTFYPEARYHPGRTVEVPAREEGGTATLRSGGTALTGRSQQRFTEVSEIEIDHRNAVVIYLRLVEEDRYNASDRGVRPLGDVRKTKSNLAPAPVED